MIKHKLIQILKTFTKEEFSDFEKFVASPFHNEGRNYQPFVKEIKKYYPSFESKNFTKENVFGKIYAGKKYTASLADTTLSRVLKMAESFLGYKTYIKKTVSAKYDYITELMSRELYSFAEKELKEYSRLVALSEGITDELIKGRMDYEILSVQLNFRMDRQQESAGPALNQIDYHIRFTLMRLAHFVHTLRVNNIIFNVDYNRTFIKEYLSAVNLKKIYNALKKTGIKNELNEVTLIYVLWILGVTDSKNENHFYEMKTLVLKNLGLFHHHEKYNLFQALEALAWLAGQELNREKYDMELLEVYKKRLENKVLSPDNTHMRIILFRAILITSFYKPDWNFIHSFVETCIPLLHDNHKDNMYNYSMAHINYHKRNYEEALKFNNKINFELFAFKYDTRLLQFKIYYELNYFEEARSLIDSHRHFIAKNKTVSAYYRQMHTNFLNFYGELLRAKEGRAIDYKLLGKNIRNTNNVINKEFLLDKLEELSRQH